MKTFYITRYALTKGIIKVDGEKSKDFPTMIVCNYEGYTTHFHGEDWHAAKEDAISKAEQMRKKKIASLEKQLEKFRTMEIKIKE